MSCIYIYKIHPNGDLEEIGEVRNSWRFHVAIWDGLMNVHGIPHTSGLDMKGLEKLWSRVATLPRPDGLLVAATFDRCWFDPETTRELIAAMVGETRFSSSCYEVARVIEKHGAVGVRGFAFSGSLSSPWYCQKNDGLHQLDEFGHACVACGKKIQNAHHMLTNMDCCREPEDAVYRADS